VRRTGRVVAAALVAAGAAGCGSPTSQAVGAAPTAAARSSASPEETIPVVQSGDGQLEVVPGASDRSGPGELTTYVVEVERGLGINPAEFADAVETTLADPRSWGADGRRALQRIDDEDAADLRVTLASPDLTDQLCAPLRTGGYFSCANGDRAVLNVARWLRGAPSYAGHLEDYRAYVVNHEVGHTLGFGHAGCPAEGQPAPVMLQQTKGLQGCTRGPWPYP
jgi:hypothetical protein